MFIYIAPLFLKIQLKIYKINRTSLLSHSYLRATDFLKDFFSKKSAQKSIFNRLTKKKNFSVHGHIHSPPFFKTIAQNLQNKSNLTSQSFIFASNRLFEIFFEQISGTKINIYQVIPGKKFFVYMFLYIAPFFLKKKLKIYQIN